ncbi:cytochrome b-c1 complex subunit 6, mitochondrial-like [Agrilus planipennis]|uniref:Cytochrome b-c1 complex subunit 6 n=1 Tax=Agrilus planipennis TaxID=224129 RepID=A0A1W4WZ17_AGRPL|nr:cytochrome b-c1 complex subunit 6, mitochondrial [Agrilus planipennis]XP_025829128.1 cytochrome b-c1 complex subunit 6, mitochondrial-like [Agrilus planipennis]
MFFGKILSRLLPVIKADDEDLVDPQQELRNECRESHCKNFAEKLEECTTRVTSKTKTTETCVEELIDLMHCLDHCVTPHLFSKLK